MCTEVIEVYGCGHERVAHLRPCRSVSTSQHGVCYEPSKDRAGEPVGHLCSSCTSVSRQQSRANSPHPGVRTPTSI